MSHVVRLLQPPWESGRALLSPHLIAQPQNGLFCANPVRRHVLAHPADWRPGLSFPSWIRMVVVQLLSHLWLFATPWTTAYQAPLSMGFPRQEYWSRLPFPFSRGSSWSRDQTCVSCIAGDSSPPEPPEKPLDENKVKNTGGEWVDSTVTLRILGGQKVVSNITEAELGKEQMRQSIFGVEKIREKVVVGCLFFKSWAWNSG